MALKPYTRQVLQMKLVRLRHPTRFYGAAASIEGFKLGRSISACSGLRATARQPSEDKEGSRTNTYSISTAAGQVAACIAGMRAKVVGSQDAAKNAAISHGNWLNTLWQDVMPAKVLLCIV